MLSEMQRKKAIHMFNIYDRDRDGVIGWEDYSQYATRLSKRKGWHPESHSHRRFHEKAHGHWKRMRSHADADRDENINVEEYIAYIDAWLDEAQRTDGSTTVDAVADLWFDTLDEDHDDRVTVEEYRHVLHAYGLEHLDADGLFRRFDEDGDGFLSRADVRELNRQYWFSHNPSEPGNHLLGPYE